MIFISPPFGNYINLPYTTQIHGSFTPERRDGILWRIFETLRYSRKYGGWVNKIGLRNPGIDWALKNLKENDIISLAIRNTNDIDTFYSKIPINQNIEINISCPNVEKDPSFHNKLRQLISSKRTWCIIKLSPHTTEQQIDLLYKQGFRHFHCCNTLPVKEGGLSGPSLRPYSIRCIQYISSKYPQTTIIAGGGIQTPDDLYIYRKKGASHFSISSVLFHPFLFIPLYYNYVRSNFR